MKNLLTHNLTLKLISLGLAIIVWFYVSQEIKKWNIPQPSQTNAKARS